MWQIDQCDGAGTGTGANPLDCDDGNGCSLDGLSLAILKGGAAGKSKALAKGKGAALPDLTLPVSHPVTVQIKKDARRSAWRASSPA